MSDREKDSIKKASDLINSVLYSKGYFHDSGNEGSPIDGLKFSTIDELLDPKEIYQNDELVINTIFQLIQELDRSKTERMNLDKQLIKMNETIRSLQNQMREIEAENQQTINKFKSITNKHDLLEEKLKQVTEDNVNFEKLINFEKNFTRSIKKKFEIDLNRKNRMILDLQQRLITNNHRVKNSKDIYNFNSLSASDETSLIVLQNRIEEISTEQHNSIIFLNFLLNYLNLLIDNKENLPSTPIFYFEHFEKQLLLMSDKDENILLPLDIVKKDLFESLDRFYDLITSSSDSSNSSNNRKSSQKANDSRIIHLEREIEVLKKNLNSALETNEKWSKKFQVLNQKNVS